MDWLRNLLIWLFLFVISPPVFLTIPATLIAGFGTSMVLTRCLSSMSHHYGKAAEVAIPQANGIASVGFVTGTALIGTIASLYPRLLALRSTARTSCGIDFGSSWP